MISRMFLAAGLAGTIALAEKPALEHIHPAAVAQGGTNILNLTGKFNDWPPKIWCSSGGLDFSFSTNKGTVEVKAATNAPAGPCLVRLYNDEGSSDPAIFVISTESHLPDIEPNNHFAKSQVLTNLPATVSGRLDKNNDVDSFAFTVRAGQWLDARLESHTLMSKLDAVLRLVTTNGYQIAWNHDFSSLDPRLVWRAPSDQQVVLQVFGFAYPAGSEIALSGGNGGVYQLAINVRESEPTDLSAPLQEEAKVEGSATTFHGVIRPAGDEDNFSIQLKKDEWIEAKTVASAFGSDLDPWVKITDREGKELARNDDAEGTRDALLEWKALADGDYQIVVGSLAHRGKEDWRYRLQVAKVLPTFEPTVEASSFIFEPTATNELKVTTKRLRGFTNELTVSVEGTPKGMKVEPVTVGSKDGSATLKIVTEEAEAFNGPLSVTVVDNVTHEHRVASFQLVSRSENNGVPGGYSKLLIESTAHLWFTIKPPKEKPPVKTASASPSTPAGL